MTKMVFKAAHLVQIDGVLEVKQQSASNKCQYNYLAHYVLGNQCKPVGIPVVVVTKWWAQLY